MVKYSIDGTKLIGTTKIKQLFSIIGNDLVVPG